MGEERREEDGGRNAKKKGEEVRKRNVLMDLYYKRVYDLIFFRIS